MDRVFKIILGMVLLGVGLGLASHGIGQADRMALVSAYAALLGGVAFLLPAVWPAHRIGR